MKRSCVPSVLSMALAIFARAASGEGLAKEALSSFPLDTMRVEYSSLSKLRTLPNYVSLRQRYVGAPLQKLEASLSELGVVENDIDELMLGWRPGSGGLDLYGLATGRFDTATIAKRAKARNLEPETVAGRAAYCLEAGLAANCVVVVEKSLGAFGTLASLTALLGARGGEAPALGSNERFARLLNGAQTELPIWGVALGSGGTDWFKGWMPSQGNIQLDWSRVFQGIESLAYSVEAADKVKLAMKLECVSSDSAASLRQILEGLKLAQQLAWQSQNPNRPNPFESVDVELANRQVGLKITTPYAALEGIGAGGAP